MKKILLTILFVFFLTSPALGATTYYVDWDNGNDANDGHTNCPGASCEAFQTPWATGLHNVLTSGDTVIIYAKDDGSPYNNGTSAAIDAQEAGVTWQAASGETVKLSITSTYGYCDASMQQDKQIVKISASNVTVDGFYIWGAVYIGSTGDYATVENCDISGGLGQRDGFVSPIYLWGTASCQDDHSGSGEVDGARIYNNKIHDNCSNQTYGNCASDRKQCPLIMVYCADGTVYENNEFYNSYAAGVWEKGGAWNTVGRYNFFHDMPSGYPGVMGTAQYFNWGPYYWYQNVFITGSDRAVDPYAGGSLIIYFYNNTIYGSGMFINGNNWATYSVFNNLVVATADHTYAVWHGNSLNAGGRTTFSYSDYNDFYLSVAGTYRWRFEADGNKDGLAAWQGYSSLDTHSTTADPGFVGSNGDGTGSFTLPEHFRRLSYTANGAGTNGPGGLSWPTVMGAYITGNEVIGVTGGSATATSAGISAVGVQFK